MAPHLLYLYGWALLPGLYRAFLVGGIYVSGMLIYYFQIPEFWFPGKFDCNVRRVRERERERENRSKLG